MRKELLYKMSSPYRDDFKIYGYRFGEGSKSLAVVGAMRGDEIEQQYVCASLIKALKQLEDNGALIPDFELVVIPSVNPFSMNIEKRFWSMDGTDINRMFPGYSKGETTQRIASALFEQIKDYTYGIQLASNYISGQFTPHIRMFKTGYQPEQEAKYFGLSYVYVKDFNPYDTALLNYNWQIWNTKAFSLYTSNSGELIDSNTGYIVKSILRFMVNIGIISTAIRPGFQSQVITDADLVTLSTKKSGLLRRKKGIHDSVSKGEVIAEIIDPYDASIIDEISSPIQGELFFCQDKPLVLEGARIFQIIEDRII